MARVAPTMMRMPRPARRIELRGSLCITIARPSGKRLAGHLIPFALRFQNTLNRLANGGFSAAAAGDIVRGTFYFGHGIGYGNGKASAPDQGQVGQIIANISDL